MAGTSILSVHWDVNILANGFLDTSQSILSFLISNFCRQNFTLFKNLLVRYGYRQLITEYLISDRMKLLLFRSSLKRRGNNRQRLTQPVSVPISLKRRGNNRQTLTQPVSVPISLKRRGNNRQTLTQPVSVPISLKRRGNNRQTLTQPVSVPVRSAWLFRTE